MKHVQYQTQGTCSVLIDVVADENDIIQNGTSPCVARRADKVRGCSGNLQGICRLVKGQKIDDVIGKLDGIRCGNKLIATHRSSLRAPLELAPSCPDQLCRALEQLKRVKYKDIDSSRHQVPSHSMS